MRRIKEDYSNIKCTGIPTGKPKHGFVHEIETTDGPILSKYRRFDPAKLAAAKEYFGEMMEAGICTRSDFP